MNNIVMLKGAIQDESNTRFGGGISFPKGKDYPIGHLKGTSKNNLGIDVFRSLYFISRTKPVFHQRFTNASSLDYI